MKKKICKRCKKEKELTEFYKQAGGVRGYYAKCKVCTQEERRLRQAQKKNNNLYTKL